MCTSACPNAQRDACNQTHMKKCTHARTHTHTHMQRKIHKTHHHQTADHRKTDTLSVKHSRQRSLAPSHDSYDTPVHSQGTLTLIYRCIHISILPDTITMRPNLQHQERTTILNGPLTHSDTYYHNSDSDNHDSPIPQKSNNSSKEHDTATTTRQPQQDSNSN